MPVSEADLKASGMKEIDDFIQIPDEWDLKGYRTLKGKDGRQYILVVYGRPNESDIELFSHSLEIRLGKVYSRPSHLERQAAQAAKR